MMNSEIKEKTEGSSLHDLRDRLAYLFAKHVDVIRPLLCGLAMAWVVISVLSYPTPLSKWTALLALGVLGLTFLRIRLAASAMGLICTVQMMAVHPNLGWMTALLSIVFVMACGRYAGRMCGVLVAPYLMHIHLGLAAPLGLAGGSKKPVAWLWSAMAFLWCAFHGFVSGHPRIGVESMPRFDDAAQALARRGMRFDMQWVNWAFAHTDLGELWGDFLIVTVTNGNGIFFVLQVAGWAGIAWLMRHLYRRPRLKDQLALEYLERLTKTSEPRKETPFYRKFFGIMITGGACFVVTYIILDIASRSIRYGIGGVVFDALAWVLATVPLYVMVEGDPKGVRKRKPAPAAPRQTSQAQSAAVSLKNFPPVSGPEKRVVGRRPPTVKRAGGGTRPPSVSAGGGPRIEPPVTPGPEQPNPGQAVVARARARMAANVAQAAVQVEAIVFIDMVDSTAMGSKYGDAYVLTLKEKLADVVQTESKRQNVLFSKGTGDGYMLTFPEALDAVRAAVGVMRGVLEANTGVPDPRALHLRIGIHMGEVTIDSAGDRLGTAANFASRVESAKREQLQTEEDGDDGEVVIPERDRIFVSEVITDEMEDIPGFEFRPVGYFEFKGINGLHKVYELEVS